MSRPVRLLFVATIVASTLPHSVFLEEYPTVSTVLVLTLLGGLAVAGLVSGSRSAPVPQYAILTLAGLWALLAINAIVRPALADRALVFVAVTGIGLLLVPWMVSRAFVFRFVARLAAVVAVLGLPAVVFGPFTAFGETVGHPWAVELLGLPVRAYPLVSYYTNPNFVSPLLLVGAIAAFREAVERDRSAPRWIFATNAVGLYLTQTRSAIAMGVVALALYGVYVGFGVRAFRTAVIAGGTALATTVLVVIGILPGPDVVSTVDLSGRGAVWRASVALLSDRPWLGHGPVRFATLIEPLAGLEEGPHNSYLRMFLRTGLIGGGAYTALVLTTLVGNLSLPQERLALANYLTGLAIAGVMVFEHFVLGAVNSMAILATVVLGYLVRDLTDLESETYDPLDAAIRLLSDRIAR